MSVDKNAFGTFEMLGPFSIYPKWLTHLEFAEHDGGVFAMGIAAFRDGDTLRPGERNRSAIVIAYDDVEARALRLVFDRHLARPGIEVRGAHETLVREFRRIEAMRWREFRSLCMRHPFLRPSFDNSAFWEEAQPTTAAFQTNVAQQTLIFE